MKKGSQFYGALLLALLTVKDFYSCSGLPLSRQDNAEFWEKQAALRATLITKDTFRNAHSRHLQHQQQTLPAPFVISTNLNVHSDDDDGIRRGRSYPDKDGSTWDPWVEGIRVPDDKSDRITWRNGRVINNVFVPNDAPVPAERVVSTARIQRQPKMYARQWQVSKPSGGGYVNYGGETSSHRARAGLPYRAYDFDDHYAGRTPDLPDSLAVESRQAEVIVNPDGSEVVGEPRDYSYHAGNTDAGRPVYYVVEETDSLHEDRSPYDFEPADTHTSFTSAVSDYTQAGVAAGNTHPVGPLGAGSTPADSNDFIIKEHTYTMCPGCPTFSIPIPIPKSTLVQPQQQQQPGPGGYPYHSTNPNAIEYQHANDKSFLQKIGDRIVTSVKNYPTNAKRLFDMVKGSVTGLFSTGNDDEDIGNESFVDDNSVDGSNTFQEKVDTSVLDETDEKQDDDEDGLPLPIVMSTAAALALGAFILIENGVMFATSQTDKESVDKLRSFRNGKSLKNSPKTTMEEQEQIDVLESIENAEEKYGHNDESDIVKDR